ncbi:DUF4113 domain-containing protein [Nitrincola schmidtii]
MSVRFDKRDGISQSWQMKRENLSPCYTT